ncbi:hypothetical protein AKJ58_01685 [candidate division MSBL1 archaeon SCGC-AAA385D11]|uniref:Resolvase HTH domain-containing protein n=1 Tax=candidate division MSBL1 archaeon SCGC-AAA385D11 TaxID=1698286 RepID=A0A133VN23_9EURY|nr:hypothetical protein AKJ58_01685 [candidate division MSBL1 archaeon SCGC-AAA385D11]
MPRRKVSEEDIERMKSLKNEGLTYEEIAEEFDVSYSTVAKYLRGVGKKTKITPEILEKMKNLRESGLTYEEIAKELDFCYSTVAKYMKKEGLGGRRKKVTSKMMVLPMLSFKCGGYFRTPHPRIPLRSVSNPIMLALKEVPLKALRDVGRARKVLQSTSMEANGRREPHKSVRPARNSSVNLGSWGRYRE